MPRNTWAVFSESLRTSRLVLVIVGGGVLERAAAGRQQLLHPFVDRHVAADLVLQPVVIEQRRLVADVVGRADLQQFRPLHHPQLGEFLAAQQLIDQLLALVRRGVGHELLVLLRRRQHADHVEVGPPQKDLVGAQFGRGDAQLAELGVNQSVDVVVFGDLREGERQPLGQHDHLGADGEGGEAGHDEGLAAVAGRHHAVGRNLGRRVVVAEEQGQRGHVAHGAVGVAGADDHLLRRALAVEHRIFRIEIDGDRLGDVRRVERGAGVQPADQRLMVFVAVLDALAAGVGDLARRPSRSAGFRRARRG